MSEDLKNSYSELYKVILSLKSENDCKEFFLDLLTNKELDSLAQRVSAGKMLKQGKTYEQIISKTNISSATLSRISRSLKNGTGYKKFL